MVCRSHGLNIEMTHRMSHWKSEGLKISMTHWMSHSESYLNIEAIRQKEKGRHREVWGQQREMGKEAMESNRVESKGEGRKGIGKEGRRKEVKGSFITGCFTERWNCWMHCKRASQQRWCFGQSFCWGYCTLSWLHCFVWWHHPIPWQWTDGQWNCHYLQHLFTLYW